MLSAPCIVLTHVLQFNIMNDNAFAGLFPQKVDLCVNSTRKDRKTVRGITLMPDGMAYASKNYSGDTLDFSQGDLAFECKSLYKHDPFPKDFGPSVNVAPLAGLKDSGCELAIGQLADYITAMAHAACRTHVLLVFIYQGRARFIRWDHSAAVVSRSICLLREVDLFAMFMHAFAVASPAARGRVPTVSKLPEQVRLFQSPHLSARDDLRHAIEQCRDGESKNSATYAHYQRLLDDTRPLQQFRMEGLNGELYDLIASSEPSFFTPDSIGRGTYGWVVFNVQRKELNWLKRIRHEDVDNVRHEANIYFNHLHGKDIPNLPNILGHGDVAEDANSTQTVDLRWHRTITSHIKASRSEWTNPNSRNYLRPPRQYQLLLEQVGTPLYNIRSTRLLVFALLETARSMCCILGLNMSYTTDKAFRSIGGLLYKSRCLASGC
jgi:hypothetical protein